MQPAACTSGPQSYYVCVDVGGTKTAAVIADQAGKEISRGYAESGNMAELGAALSAERIKSAIRAAAGAISSGSKTVATREDKCPFVTLSAWLGIAGCDSELDARRMVSLLEDFFDGASLRVTNDGQLVSAPILQTSSQWGICLVAGTGSVISGVINNGGTPIQFARRGGHGHIFGDEGSAYYMGVAAVRNIANAVNCGEDLSSSLMTTTICAAVGAENPADLPTVLHDLDPSLGILDAVNRRKLRIAALAIPVVSAASSQRPDRLARITVDETAEVLASEIEVIVRIASTKGLSSVSSAMLSCVGGLISQPIYMRAVEDALCRKGIKFNTVRLVQDAAAEGIKALLRSGIDGES